MKRITLPVLRQTASAREAWNALRQHHAHGVVAQRGTEFLLYDADDIADAVHTRLTLQQVHGRSIPALPEDQHSSEQALRQFFDHFENEMVVMSAADRVFAADMLTLFARAGSPIAGFEATAYRCPEDPNEVSNRKLHCKIHDVDYIADT
jgi:hypothetical protein